MPYSPLRSFFIGTVAVGLFGSMAPLPAQSASTAVLNGQVYVNQGLVGVGRIPSAARDKFGETIGSFSALTVDAKSWKRNGIGRPLPSPEPSMLAKLFSPSGNRRFFWWDGW